MNLFNNFPLKTTHFLFIKYDVNKDLQDQKLKKYILLDSFSVLVEELRLVFVVEHDGGVVQLWNWARLGAGVLEDVVVPLAGVEAGHDLARQDLACVIPVYETVFRQDQLLGPDAGVTEIECCNYTF